MWETVTFALERGLVQPAKAGVLYLDTPAGRVEARYRMENGHVEAVRIVNVGAYLAAEGVEVDCPELGRLTVDIAYGGNFYAIVEPQEGYRDMADLSPGDILRLSPALRQRLNETVEMVHPEDDTIRGVSHVLWTGKPTKPEARGDRTALTRGREYQTVGGDPRAGVERRDQRRGPRL